MDNTREMKYVSSLEKTIQNDYYFLKGTLEDFREMCSLVSPDKNLPSGVIADIRELYKEIQNRLSEVKAIQQLLQGKYRRHHRRNPVRDKEMLEWGFIVKTLYNKLEANVKQKEEKKKQSERERPLQKGLREGLVRWFHSSENRIFLLKISGCSTISITRALPPLGRRGARSFRRGSEASRSSSMPAMRAPSTASTPISVCGNMTSWNGMDRARFAAS